MAKRSKSPLGGDAAAEVEHAVEDTKKFIDKTVGEIGKTAATQQLILGSVSGWIAGFIAMRLGKVSSIAIGGSAIMLHIAHQQGYIDFYWKKVCKNVDKLSDKLEEKATGSTPGLMDKVGRFVDRKLDKVEVAIKKKQLETKKWYHSVTGDEHYRATETHIFLASFVAGLALGLLCGR